MGFLGEVVAHESYTKMTSENLAIVFAPNLLRQQVEAKRTGNAAVMAAMAAMRENLKREQLVIQVDAFPHICRACF